ncbi:MAG TPA: aldehyde dehydrogenase family protein [Candidatus Krumholzibacteria bacterium]|nr:aldehyde dehydrogenase family protein [Candidatus Krumholzibacteria bacterium]
MLEMLNYIDGKWVRSRTGRSDENRNPADHDEVVCTFQASSAEDVDAAVAAAKRAYRSWRLVPAPRRAEYLFKVGAILAERKEQYARDMTREMGKVLAETRGDVQEGIDTAFLAGGEGRRLFGDAVPCELPNKAGWSERHPIGVCGLITPWNFPMAIPTWKLFPALVCGNTAVIKPASDTPLSVWNLVKACEDAGLPPGVVNLVTGDGRSVGNRIVEHPDVRVISFTGSSDVGRRLGESCGRTLKRVSLELGGKNAQIVMEDADLELALEGVLWGAFGTTGQRCTATSRLILHRPIRKRFVEMLEARVRTLKLGNGLDESVQIGPTVSKSQRASVHGYVEVGKNEDRARLVCGGEFYTRGECEKGWFYAPTIFDGVTRSMRIAREEIFGPVLSVLEANDLDDAIETLNDTDYGLSSSIYTRDVNNAFRAIRDIEAGITYVNGPTIGAEVQLPFGGVKDTGNGHREASHTVLDIFTEWKSVYVDYSGRLQRAQIDTDAGE